MINPIKRFNAGLIVFFAIGIAMILIGVICKFNLKENVGEVLMLTFCNSGAALVVVTGIITLVVKLNMKRNAAASFQPEEIMNYQLQSINNSVKLQRLQIANLQQSIGEPVDVEVDFTPYTDVISANKEIIANTLKIQELQIKIEASKLDKNI